MQNRTYIYILAAFTLGVAFGTFGYDSIIGPKIPEGYVAIEQMNKVSTPVNQAELDSYASALEASKKDVLTLQLQNAKIDEDKMWQTAGSVKDFPNNIGKIISLDSSKVSVDPIVWLSSDGTPGCTNFLDIIPDRPKCNPNGFLVINHSTTSREILLSEKLKIEIIDPATGNSQKEITLTEFLDLYKTNPQTFSYRLFHFIISKDKVISISEQYTP